jgi:hypothetical protein
VVYMLIGMVIFFVIFIVACFLAANNTLISWLRVICLFKAENSTYNLFQPPK